MQAIETEYKGYRFRSRLEARWAVFFDAMYIDYDYEPEGFNLNGVYYLPDFYLPSHDIYVEIKPFDRSVVKYVGDGNKWEQKCALFRDIVNKAILLCYDDPASNVFRLLFAYDYTDSSGGSSEHKCFFDVDGDILTSSYGKEREICINSQMETNQHVRQANEDEWYALMDNLYDPKDVDRLTLARTAARQARFEHGEKPTLPFN